jgi:branched-chain amino acid transport system ATP-binding protein
VLKVEGLTCRYGKVAAVRDLSNTVNAGELVALIGGNGAGKTTTLKAISGLIAPLAGLITFLGEDITRAAPRHILTLGIAHCPEGRHVFSYMTVAENLEMGCYLRREKSAIAADMAELFARFPSPRRAPPPGRRHAFRGRAADAGDRSCPDVPPQARAVR